MGYVTYASDVKKLEGHEPFRDGGCVALVQAVTDVGHTSRWKPGPRVVDLNALSPGTVIANFEFNDKGIGKFPNKHGHHAALFMEFGPKNMTTGKPARFSVMDQFLGRSPKNVVKKRDISARGRKSKAQGNRYYDCDNADQFYVVVI